MFYSSRSIVATTIALLLVPMLAVAQDADAPAGGHKLADLAWNVTPFIVLSVLFWFFFIRSMKTQQKTAISYRERNEQHMDRVEQLMERIAEALEKDKS